MSLPDAPWWLWLFFGIGVYAALIQVLKFFLAFQRALPDPKANTVPGVQDQAFLDALAMTVDADVVRGGTVRILNNGDDFFPALLDAIRTARHSIHLMTYIWKRGRLSDEVFEALIARAQRGVEVRVMIDGLGGFFAPYGSIRHLRRAGGEVIFFSPLLSKHFLHLNRRNHRRAFVIDGRVAFTGGISVADQWAGNAEDADSWRDVMIEVTGPPVQTIQEVFMQLWVNLRGEVLAGEGYLPDPDADDGTLRHIGIAHSPTTHIQPLRQFFWYSFKAARERIYIANSYFAPDRFLREVLMEKARAGVDVRLLLPGARTDSPLVRWHAQHYYKQYLSAGMRIYEYAPTMMHAKYLIVDGLWTITGSANIDVRSFQLSQEVILGLHDETISREMEAVFEADLKRADEITLETWRRRPWWYRCREYGALPLRAQY